MRAGAIALSQDFMKAYFLRETLGLNNQSYDFNCLLKRQGVFVTLLNLLENLLQSAANFTGPVKQVLNG